jgi:serine/threonine-protein kinase
MAAIPLRPEFRFAHEPMGSEPSLSFVGRDEEMDALAQRLLFSQGGSFLITGYRGVGKTSFVNQVIGRVSAYVRSEPSLAVSTDVVDVRLNLARALKPGELMHHIVRRLYDSLDHAELLPRLPPKLWRDLTLAYLRTSMNMSQKVAQTTERTTGLPSLEVGAAPFKISTGALLTRKSGLTRNEEASFLSYDDRAAEHDVIRLSQQLTNGFQEHGSLRRRVARRLTGKPPRRRKLKIIFIFDELDKLDTESKPEAEETRSAIDELLNVLKTLFTTSGLTFVFIAGKELQERWLEDVGRGDSVYESVFSYDRYLTCVWPTSADESNGETVSDPGSQLCDWYVDWDQLGQRRCSNCSRLSGPQTERCTICGAALPPPTLERPPCPQCRTAVEAREPFCATCGQYLASRQQAREVFEEIKHYLAYVGRGIPRRLIRAFNELVHWQGARPFLLIEAPEYRRIKFYAELQRLVQKHDRELTGDPNEESRGAQHDRRRLGVHYLIDCMLRRGSREFTFADILDDATRLSKRIAPRQEIATSVIQALIALLLEHSYIEEVSSSDQALIGQDKAPERYRVTAKRLFEMGEQPLTLEEDVVLTAAPDGVRRALGSYRLVEQIGKGGMGDVYRAIDTTSGATVAVKALPPRLISAPDIAERFARETAALRRLRHPHLVRFVDAGEVEGQPYVAMELIDGLDLRQLLSASRRLPVSRALEIARAIAQVAAYIHEQGFTRLDIKPGNVMLTSDGRIVMLDLGLIRDERDPGHTATNPNLMLGTPAYMAPEQITASGVDARADVYALGCVLYEMLSGRTPVMADTPMHTAIAQLSQQAPPLSTLVDVPEALDAVVMRAIQKHPAERFQTMLEFELALSQNFEEPEAPGLDWIVKSSRESLDEHDKAEHENTIYQTRDFDTGISAAPRAAHTFTTPSLLVLRAIEGPEPAGTEHKLGDAETRIGRGPDNDIVINSPTLSRYHAAIRRADGELLLVDQNTANGTYVNGERVRDVTPLRLGDRIHIGNCIFELSSTVDAIRPVASSDRVQNSVDPLT